MALDYSLHTVLAATAGRSPSLPSLPPIGGQKSLALNTNSDAITGPVEICLTPEEKVRLDVKAASADLSPVASPLVIPAGVTSWFHLPAGSWYLKAVAA